MNSATTTGTDYAMGPSEIFPIKPPPPSMMRFLIGVEVAMAVFMVVLSIQTSGIAWILGATFLPIMLVLWIVVTSGRKATFKVSRSGLEICGDWAGESFPWRDLDIENARIVKFDEEPDLRPKWKKCGTAMPGYCSGSFSLHNKGDALVILTDKKEAVLVPTRTGRVILLSAENNERFLHSLKAHAGTTRVFISEMRL